MKRVAVLRGGPSEEYSVSMNTGRAVLSALQKLDYPFKDIVITKKGEWLDNGFTKQPEKALDAIDVVFIAIHGQYGEDGQVQRILERKKVPYVGTRALPSAIAFNKELTKHTLLPYGVKMPRHRRVNREELDRLSEEIPHIFEEIGRELFVKPVASGSSVGARHIPHPEALRSALTELLEQYEQVLVEEYIRGKEATVGVLDDFRNEAHYALPVVEIVPPRNAVFYDTKNKYDGTTDHVCPGRFTYHEKANMEETARLVHKVIGCTHLSRSDFLVKDGEIYFLEVNTLPGFTEHSNYPYAAAEVGLEFPELVRHLVESAHV